MTQPNSPCIEHLDGNRYRCANRGWVIKTNTLPIRCGCNGVREEPKKAATNKGTPARDVMANYYAKIADLDPPVPLETLLARTDKCVTMSCEHFDEKQAVCAKFRGSPCKRGQRWFEMLMSPNGCKLQEADHAH